MVNCMSYLWVIDLSAWIWPNFEVFWLFLLIFGTIFVTLTQNEYSNTLRLSSNLLLRSTVWVICEFFTFQYDFGPILRFFWPFLGDFSNFLITLTPYECLKTLIPSLSLHLRSIVWVISELLTFPCDFGPILKFFGRFWGIFKIFLSVWLKLSV